VKLAQSFIDFSSQLDNFLNSFLICSSKFSSFSASAVIFIYNSSKCSTAFSFNLFSSPQFLNARINLPKIIPQSQI
jgi:hypothetical protein